MVAPAPVRKARSLVQLAVLRTERLTPHMIRVVLGGPGLADFVENGYTDAYVKLVFPVPGVHYPQPLDLGVIRAQLPAQQWPTTRTYTVRSLDRQAGELAIDFVVHGDEGIAGPWAAGARPGDTMWLAGPGGGYRPRTDVDWHLLVGDESAIPAIGAALEAMPSNAVIKAFIQVSDRSEEQTLVTKGDLDITWLSRSSGDADLVAAVQGFAFKPGRFQAFVHGEAGFVRPLRRHLLDERGVSKELLSLSGYWRLGKNEDGWQAEKKAEKAANANKH
jgi:NADPH-dependent ferric siderophore reductase